jgi:hypothetical protein
MKSLGGRAMSLGFASADPAPRDSESPPHATRWVATWRAVGRRSDASRSALSDLAITKYLPRGDNQTS